MLDFELKLSKQYLFLVLIILLISMGMVKFIPTTRDVKWMVLLGTFVYGSWIIWQFILRCGRDSLVSIQHIAENKWLLRTRTQLYQATLCGDSTITIWVSVLRFKLPGSYWKKSYVIFSDSLQSGDYRKLLVQLKMG